MASTKLLSISAALVATVGAAGLSQTNPQFLTKSDPQAVYMNCLTGRYAVETGKTPDVLLRSYHACQAKEAGYDQFLLAQGLSPEKLKALVIRVNEVTYARYRGVAMNRAKGCLGRALKKEELIS